jgi:hypothetical protein
MVDAKGCPSWRRQGQGIAITIEITTETLTIRIKVGIEITVGLTITRGSHCCATITRGHAGCLPTWQNAIDRYGLAHASPRRTPNNAVRVLRQSVSHPGVCKLCLRGRRVGSLLLFNMLCCTDVKF